MNTLDFNSVEFAKNPDYILSQIRNTEGLFPYEMPDKTKVYLASRREDVEFVLTQKEIFKVSPAIGTQSYQSNPFSEAIPKPLHLLATDGDVHQRLRKPLEQFFTKEILEEYRNFIQDEVLYVLKSWKTNDEVDLAENLSYLIPVKTISKMLGIEWSPKFSEYAIALQMVKAEPENYLPTVVEFHQLLKAYIQKKKDQNKDDIISVLLKEGLSEDEVLSVSLLLFIAGTGTTASLIVQGLHKIMTSKQKPEDNLVDQILFKTSPANSAFPRYVHQDVTLSGTLLQKGDMVLALLASANYDVKGNEDPLKSYLSFSKGIHHCIGWYLAKMEAEIVFNNFYQCFPNSKILQEVWFSNIISRDIVSLQVKLG